MRNLKTKATFIVFSVYIILLSWLILLKLATGPEMIPHMRNINLIPFAESVYINGKLYAGEIIYNILAFVPLGVYLSIFKGNWPVWKIAGAALGLSLFYEVTQYIFALGGSDVTDLIGNTLGGLLGVFTYYIFQSVFKERAVLIVNITGAVIEICAICLALLLSLAG